MSTLTHASAAQVRLFRARPSRARSLRDALATAVMTGAFLLTLVPLLWILWTVTSRGWVLLLDTEWWTNSQRGITSRREGGGAYHAVMGTVLQAGLTAAIAVPVGVLTAVYLVEYGRGRLARAVGFMVDVLTGIPSIVSALFVYALWITTFGLRRVGFAVSLALVLLMIPVVVRTSEEMLRIVPSELREASLALGVPKWRTVTSVVIPTAFSGIVTGIMLGLARVMGETAPLLILGPYAKSINLNPFSGNMAALPTMINQDRTESLAPAIDRTWAAALTLILLVLGLNLLARALARVGTVRS